MPWEITRDDIKSYPEQYPKVKEWLNSWTSKTKIGYARASMTFERTTKTSLQTLLEQLENNQIKPTYIRSLILKTAQNQTNSNQLVTEAAIRSFFKYWGHREIPSTNIKYKPTKYLRGYTKQEYNNVYGYLDKPLEKLYFTMVAESGLRADAALKLKYKHVQADLNNRNGSIWLDLEPSFHFGRKKTGYIFIGIRSRQLLNDCIKNKLVQTDPESNLFPWKDGQIRKIVKTAMHKAGLAKADIKPIHGLRKYFKMSIMSTKPPMDEGYQRMLMGRFSDIDAKAYNPRDHQTLRPEYERAYPHLDRENNTPELATENANLQDTIDHLRQQITQIDSLKQQIAKLQAERGAFRQADFNILRLLTSPNAIKLLSAVLDKMEQTKTLEAITSNIPPDCSPVDIDNAVYTYLHKQHPEIVQEFWKNNPQFTTKAYDKKLLAELSGKEQKTQ